MYKTKPQSHGLLTLAILTAIGSAGCGAAPEGLQEEADIGTAEAPLTLTALPKRGGSGGTAWGTPLRDYYGFRVRSGAYVDALTLAYRDEYGDNWIGPFGGRGGTEQPWTYCSGADKAVGYFGYAGSYVDRLGLICQDANGRIYATSSYGGYGGSWYFDFCPTGKVVKYFIVWAESWGTAPFLHAIQGYCG
jgi:hypothetical protein